MLSIKVLGSGCRNCKNLLKQTKQAVKDLDLEANVEYVEDLNTIMDYGVMATPALVINEQVVASGRVLKAKDIEKLLQEAL